jgi:hypothetical protein
MHSTTGANDSVWCHYRRRWWDPQRRDPQRTNRRNYDAADSVHSSRIVNPNAGLNGIGHQENCHEHGSEERVALHLHTPKLDEEVTCNAQSVIQALQPSCHLVSPRRGDDSSRVFDFRIQKQPYRSSQYGTFVSQRNGNCKSVSASNRAIRTAINVVATRKVRTLNRRGVKQFA